MRGPDGRDYRTVIRKNPLCERHWLKINDEIPCDADGFPLPSTMWPDAIRPFDLVRQVREPGGEWEDIKKPPEKSGGRRGQRRGTNPGSNTPPTYRG